MHTRTTAFAIAALLVLASLLATAAPQSAPTRITLHVAPTGNDAWTGRPAAPNSEGTDGPLASLAGARDAVRNLKTDGKLPAPVRVVLRGGTYPITEAVVFGPEDSGAFDTPITYEAFPGERPVIHGGRRIGGWKREGKLWVADIPAVKAGEWWFEALWVNGERRTPARTPNPAHVAGDYPADEDFFYSAGKVTETNAEGKQSPSHTRFHYKPGDLKAWDTLKDARVVVFHSWETSVMRVKGIDEENHILEFTGPTPWPLGNWRPDQWFFIEHLFEGLDQPGEWFLNRAEGKIYYMPMPGEDMATAEVVAPVAKQLMLVEGQPKEGAFVGHLTFRGLNFLYSEYTVEPQGHCDGQAAFSIPAAVQLTGARHCLLDRCEIGHVGTYGVWFRTGSQDNRLVQSEVFDLGAGGVRFGEGASPASEPEAAQRNVVDNCFLHDGGRIFRGAVGVWIGRSSYNTVAHSEICDFRYTGVSVGWSWGYAPTSAHHNIIEYNHIHHVGKGQLSDMGGIYCLGASPGSVLRGNHIHDCISNARVSGGWGIYFDEGSSYMTAEDNLVYNTLTGGLHQHYGQENRVVNNIFAFSHRGQLIRSREEEHISFFFERNIVYFNNDTLLGSRWGNGNFRLDNNCYWSAMWDGPADADFAGRTLAEWQAQGQDAHSIVADPLFVNPEAADFTLKPGSPALKTGFKPFDPSAAGLYGAADWVNKPKAIPRDPFVAPPRPEPTVVADGFEETAIGEKAAGAATLGEEKTGAIRVTGETAAAGKQSLKFTDAPDLKYSFSPYLVYSPHLRKGLVIAQFALRVEPGAVLYHEWRDSKNPYRTGPSIWFREGGVFVNNQKLADMPAGAWVRFEVACRLGSEATGKYALSITLPGQKPKRFEGLTCVHPEFRRLDWCGFVSNAQADTAAYLDEVDVRAR